MANGWTFDLGDVILELWGVLADKLGPRVDFGRLWSARRPPYGAMLCKSLSHVAAKLKHFGLECVIFMVLKNKCQLELQLGPIFQWLRIPDRVG